MNYLVDDFRGWHPLDYTWLAISVLSIIGVTLMMDGSTISIISAVANIVCVVLVAKGKISNYVWGTVGVVTYAYLAYTWGYYGETFLNAMYYLPMQFVGMYLWYNHKDKTVDDTVTETIHVLSLDYKQKTLLVLSIPLLIFGATYILNMIGGQLPLLDATSTVLSILAMLLMAMRLKEQWYLWIVVDIVSVYMWYVAYSEGSADGIATLLMWIVFTINAFYGLYQWNKIEKQQ